MNTTSISIPRWTYACLAVAVVLSLASLFFRHKVEHRNTAVGMAIEGDVVESLGAAQGLGFKAALKELRGQGYNSVVLSEQTVGELVSAGLLVQETIASNNPLASAPPTVAFSGDQKSLQRVAEGVRIRFPQAVVHISNDVTIDGLTAPVVRSVAAGLDPDQARAARELEMTIVARCANPTGATPDCVNGTPAWAHRLGAKILLPMGDQVLGRRDAIEPFIEKLRGLGMLYASPEFGKIGGDSNVIEKAPDISLRLQSAQTAELDKMTEAETVERYVLAARERDVRVLLVRPLTLAGPAPLTALGELGHAIGRELAKEGCALRQPHPYTDPAVPKPLFVLLGLAIAGTALGLVCSFPVPFHWRAIAGALFVIVALVSWTHAGRPFAALLAAIAFPTLAFLALDARIGKSILAEYALVSAISLAGGLAVAGMLNELPYFIRADQFFGVKAAQFTPIVIVAGYFYWRLCETRGFAKNPVLWGQVLLGILILGALTVMWMRSGNDNPAAVSGFELKIRALLARILIVRPRTKEFLLGHPLMIIGLGMMLRARASTLPKPRLGGWIALAIAGGAIGQTSIVNTMCHLHTPLEVGITRIVAGLVLGGILGLVFWAIIKRVTPEAEG